MLMSDMKDLLERLNSLGNHPDQVAAKLQAKGVKGRPHIGCDCALARYLASEYPGHSFEVSNVQVEIDGEGRAYLPSGCRLFIREFDQGGYPELVDKVAA
jgi:hypothetical protein